MCLCKSEFDDEKIVLLHISLEQFRNARNCAVHSTGEKEPNKVIRLKALLSFFLSS